MRSREKIRQHCQKLFTEEQNAQTRGFKLFVVEIELLLDLRDILSSMALVVCKNETQISIDSKIKA
jgi:hypothetical protein